MRISFLFLIFILNCWLAATTQISDKKQYLKQLIKQCQDIDRLIIDIQTITFNLDQNVALAGHPNSQTKLIIAALEDSHEIVLDMWKNTFLHNTLKTWKCPAVPLTEYAGITKYINQIQFTANSNLQTLKRQPYCYRNKRIKQQNQFITSTMNGLKDQIVSKCQGAKNIKIGTKFIETQESRNNPNLFTLMPWTYGNLTKEEVDEKIKQLSSVYGATPCPLNQPFLSENNTCVKCVGEGQIYNIELKTCKICCSGCTINGGTFDSNPSANNFVGNREDAKSGHLCLTSEPFFNGQHCISCNLPLYFNFNTKTCQSCPIETGFDTRTKSCKSNVFFISFSGKLQNYVGGPFSPPPFSILKQCHASQPYTNGTICVACYFPNFFNYMTGTCQSCPAGLKFDAPSHGCVGQGTKLNNYMLGQKNFAGKMPSFDRMIGVCPSDKRFFNGVTCIQCLSPKYFDFQTKKCEICPTKYVFDLSIQTCITEDQHFFTNINSQNIYYNGLFSDITEKIAVKRAKGLKECPIQIPFFDPKTNKCIQCPFFTPLFDIRKANCIACPSGSYFKPSARICVASQIPLAIERMIMNAV